MKIPNKFFKRATAAGVVASFLSIVAAQADLPAGKASVKHLKGAVHYSVDQGQWVPLKKNTLLEVGTLIKTAPESTATLLFPGSGHVLVANPNTVLRLAKLATGQTGLELVSETSLDLIQGSVVGAQRKTSALSAFKINGVSVPKGGNYQINSNGEANNTLPHESQLALIKSYSSVDDVPIVVAAKPEDKPTSPNGNNGVGNGEDPAPPGNPPDNDGPGTGPGNPGRGRPTRP